MMTWAANDIGTPAETRYLTYGFSAVTAPMAAVGIRAERIATYRQMRVRHNSPSADPVTIRYRLRVNGVDTSLFVDLAGSGTDGSNSFDEIDIFPGDLVELLAVKALTITSGLLNATVTIFDQ